LAVLNATGEFVGMIDEKTIHKRISNSLTYKGIGAVLILLTEGKDFAPSHLARLVEENGAKILGMMVEQNENGELQVNLKLNTTRVAGIIASLNRFGFRVKDAFMSEDYNKDNNREYEAVLKFFDF
jgi:hypothetical protein